MSLELEILENVENKLIRRKEIKFKVKHERMATPRRSEVKAKLAEIFNVNQDLVALEKIVTLHGKAESIGIARIYESRESLESLEPDYILARDKKTEGTKT